MQISLDPTVTPHVTAQDDRDAICHFLNLVHGHDSCIESWLNQAGLESYKDLIVISLDMEFLRSELLGQFNHEGSDRRLTSTHRARILAYFKALQVENIEDAQSSMNLNATSLDSALKAGSGSPTSSVVSAPSVSEKSFGHAIKKDPTQYKVLDKDAKFILWHSQFVGTLKMHEVYDIIDPLQPENQYTKDYKVKREFVFQVFSHVLNTPCTSKFLVAYHESCDPRKLYADLQH